MPDKCSKCSVSLDDDAVFCPSCATPINPQCPSCKKSVIADAKFCKYCAFDLTKKTSDDEVEKTPILPTNAEPDSRSRVEILIAEKYHAMSDSQLLSSLKQDLSGQTEKALSIALTELESRKNIDWREMSIAQTKLKEAILMTISPKKFTSSTTNSNPYNRFENVEGEEADKYIKYGGITAGISLIMVIWGYSYTNNISNNLRSGIYNLVGQNDPMFGLAKFSLAIGILGLIVGGVLVSIGFSKRS